MNKRYGRQPEGIIEQIKGEKVDIRSDLYSLGLILFYIITGRDAFTGRNIVEIFHKQVYEPIADPREFRKDISDKTRAIILKLTKKSQGERFQTPEDLVRAFDSLKGGKALDIIQTETVVAREPEPENRKKKYIYFWAALVLLVFMGNFRFADTGEHHI